MVISRVIKKIPILSDFYHYHRIFPNQVTACRGVYSSYQEALQAIPKELKSGYNQPEIAHHPNVARLTAATEVGVFDPIDYPILLWLKTAFLKHSSVFDLGGNVGLAYYAYQRYLQYPAQLNWLVCEIPEIAEAGKKLAQEKQVDNLFFTTDSAKAEGADILLTCGTLQYLETPLAELLKPLQSKPKHILINHVPLYDGETYITIQNIGYSFCPYTIQSRNQLIQSLTDLGYKLRDSWTINRAFKIPFHPERAVNAYHGFYFEWEQ
jgi:putative methyltransferase (TIGR04325 family)